MEIQQKFKTHLYYVTSFVVPVSTSQCSENVLPSSDVIPVLCGFSFTSFDISDIDLPIAFRKGKHTCTSHPLSNFSLILICHFNIVLLYIL